MKRPYWLCIYRMFDIDGRLQGKAGVKCWGDVDHFDRSRRTGLYAGMRAHDLHERHDRLSFVLSMLCSGVHKNAPQYRPLQTDISEEKRPVTCTHCEY